MTGRASFAASLGSIVLPLVGWGVFALGVALRGHSDASAFGAIAAMGLGLVALVAWIAGAVSAIVGLWQSRDDPSRSRGWSAAALALIALAPLTWVLEWVLLAYLFLSNGGVRI